MVDKYREGFDIVYGVRSDRETDTWFKRTSAQVYYKTLNRMASARSVSHKQVGREKKEQEKLLQ